MATLLGVRIPLLPFKLVHSVSRGCSLDPVPPIFSLEKNFLLEEGGSNGKSLANRCG